MGARIEKAFSLSTPCEPQYHSSCLHRYNSEPRFVLKAPYLKAGVNLM